MISAKELRLKTIESTLIECAECGKREARFEYSSVKGMVESLRSLDYALTIHCDSFGKPTFVIVRW